MDINQQALDMHKKWQGKIEVISRVDIQTKEDLAIAYTPGVAAPCLAIQQDYDKSFEYTRRSNLVAVITDGTAVLGLGDIGPAAAMPVMEGKCALFKQFGGIDAIPLCVDTKDTDTLVQTIALISKSFGGINLEDISAPRCFEVEERLKDLCDIPVFHDDQHGTAIVVAAALLNAAKVTGKNIGSLSIVINGAGAAGTAIAKLLLSINFGTLIMVDKGGIISRDEDWLTNAQRELCNVTNPENKRGSLADAVQNADVFIGVSRPGLLTQDMVRSMAKDPIIFALANPVPEIMPDEAKAAGAAVVGTGRSGMPNQINNLLAFPGIFKGALAARAPRITESMKIRAAHAIAQLVGDDLSAEYVIPDPLDPRVADAVAKAVYDEAKGL